MTSPTCGTISASEILNVHPNTVEKLIKKGAIPAAKVGRAWVMMTRDVLNYAEQQIMAQTSARLGLAQTSRRTRKSASPQSIGQR